MNAGFLLSEIQLNWIHEKSLSKEVFRSSLSLSLCFQFPLVYIFIIHAAR